MSGIFTYSTAYGAAVVLFLLNVLIGAIQAVYAAGHGGDLGISPQLEAWLAVVSTVVAAAMGLLPAVHRTPGKREDRYLLASQGQLPPDIQAKYPVVATVGEPVVEGGTEAHVPQPTDPPADTTVAKPPDPNVPPPGV